MFPGVNWMRCINPEKKTISDSDIKCRRWSFLRVLSDTRWATCWSMWQSILFDISIFFFQWNSSWKLCYMIWNNYVWKTCTIRTYVWTSLPLLENGCSPPGYAQRGSHNSKQKQSDCIGYRSISLLSIVGKVYACVALARLPIPEHKSWNILHAPACTHY